MGSARQGGRGGRLNGERAGSPRRRSGDEKLGARGSEEVGGGFADLAAGDAGVVVVARARPFEPGGLRLRGGKDVKEPVAVVAEADGVFREPRLNDGLKFFFGYAVGGEIGGDVDDALRETRGVGGIQ